MTENRYSAGDAGTEGQGNDVIGVVSVNGVNLKKGESTTIAFALHGGRDIESVFRSADSAFVRYYGYAPGQNVAKSFEVSSVFPVPTEGELNLHIEMERDEELELNVYDVYGRRIRTYASGSLFAGFNALRLNLPEMHSNVLYLEIVSNERTEVVPILYLQP
jgi:hypothetical protein